MHKLTLWTLSGAMLWAQAPDTWDSFLASLRDGREAQPPWRMVLRAKDADPAWLQDAWIRRLVGSQEFRVERLSETVARDLEKQKSWGAEPHWILVSPDGSALKEGSGRPTGEQLLETVKGLGLVPRWERRAAFLKEHPEHGPARLEDAEEKLAWGLNRLGAVTARSGVTVLASALRTESPDATTLALVDSAFKEGEEALRRFAEIPSWWNHGLGSCRRMLRLFSGRLPAGMADVADTLRDLTLEELRKDPSDERLWSQWGDLLAITRSDPRPQLAGIVPAPGQAWPPVDLVNLLMDAYSERGDWAGALEALEALDRTACSDPAEEEAWAGARYGRALLQVQRARVLARLERWEASAEAVAQARVLAGQRWGGFLKALVRRGIPESTKERATLYAASLDEETLPDPPPPVRPLLRLLSLGAPAWGEAWRSLPARPELAPWGPSEWRVGIAPPELERALRAGHGWTGARWVLLLGDDLLASGDAAPLPRELAHPMEAAAPALLQRLERFLQQHPEHRAGRRQRLRVLRSRMPNRHLEPLLAEDARLLRAPVHAGEAWTPEPALWQWAAQKVLPELENLLERWPTGYGLWPAWLAWSRLHPRQPSALALARRLPVWSSESQWSARLPAEVHKAVAGEFRSQGRFEEMRQWFKEAWVGVDKRRVQRFSAAGPPWVQAERKAVKEAILDPYREALVNLRRDAEVVALDREIAAWLDGGTAK